MNSPSTWDEPDGCRRSPKMTKAHGPRADGDRKAVEQGEMADGREAHDERPRQASHPVEIDPASRRHREAAREERRRRGEQPAEEQRPSPRGARAARRHHHLPGPPRLDGGGDQPPGRLPGMPVRRQAPLRSRTGEAVAATAATVGQSRPRHEARSRSGPDLVASPPPVPGARRSVLASPRRLVTRRRAPGRAGWPAPCVIRGPRSASDGMAEACECETAKRSHVEDMRVAVAGATGGPTWPRSGAGSTGRWSAAPTSSSATRARPMPSGSQRGAEARRVHPPFPRSLGRVHLTRSE